MSDRWREFGAALEAIDWARYPVPKNPLDGPYNRVPDAIRRILAAENEAQATAAYDFTLDAVGHNHSGTVFSVLVPALPFLIKVALNARPWPRRAALEVMIDAVSWLEWAEEPHQLAPDPDAALRCFDTHRQALRALAEDPGGAAQVRASANELLDALSLADTARSRR